MATDDCEPIFISPIYGQLLTKPLRQRMPQQGKSHCQDCQDRCNGCEDDTNLCGLARGDHVGGKIVKDVLQLIGAGCRVISTTCQFGDLFERLFIDISAEAASAASAKRQTESATELIILLELIATIHG